MASRFALRVSSVTVSSSFPKSKVDSGVEKLSEQQGRPTGQQSHQVAQHEQILGDANLEFVPPDAVDDSAGGLLGRNRSERGRNAHPDVVAALFRHHKRVEVHEGGVYALLELFDAQLVEDRLEEALHGELGDGKGGLVLHTAEAGDRGEEHDVAVIVSLHFWEDGFQELRVKNER